MNIEKFIERISNPKFLDFISSTKGFSFLRNGDLTVISNVDSYVCVTTSPPKAMKEVFLKLPVRWSLAGFVEREGKRYYVYVYGRNGYQKSLSMINEIVGIPFFLVPNLKTPDTPNGGKGTPGKLTPVELPR